MQKYSPPVPSTRLRSLIFSYWLMQAANYIAPLLVLPYVIRILGPSVYGKVVYVQAITSYCCLIVEYGFSWSATRKIASVRHDNGKINLIFNSTWSAQWLLTFFAFIASGIFLYITNSSHDIIILYLVSFSNVIACALTPTWFLQGVESVKFASEIQLISRFASVALTIGFVKDASDALLFIFATSAPQLIGGFLVIAWIAKIHRIRFSRPNLSNVFTELREGFNLFLSRISTSAYGALVPIILGNSSGTSTLAYFALADKIRAAFQYISGPIIQATYPRITFLLATDSKKAYSILLKSSGGLMILSLTTSAFLYLFSPKLIILFGGLNFAPSILILKILSPLPFVVTMSNILGLNVMIAKGFNKEFSRILLIGAFAGISILIPLVNHYGATGAALAIGVAEVSVTLLMLLFVFKRSLLLSRLW